jgi:hypothetical protein
MPPKLMDSKKAKLPRPEEWGFASRAYTPSKENKHFHIAPLDPVLKDGRSALRQHFVRGERAGRQTASRTLVDHPRLWHK